MATFTGTTYQAGLIAYAYVHMLAFEPLGWFSHLKDVPLAVAGETDGPGDDIRLSFGSLDGSVEVQAKTGLSGGIGVDEVMERIRTKSAGSGAMPIGLVVDRRTTPKIREQLAADVERIRKGRTDKLHSEAQRLLDGGYSEELSRVHVISADVTLPANPEVKVALLHLRRILASESQAEQAWAVLLADGGMLCASRSQRTRMDLVQLLEKAGIGLALLPAASQPERDLNRAEDLLDALQPAVAVVELARLEETAVGRAAPRELRSRLLFLRARAQLQLGQVSEADEAAIEASALDPSSAGPLRVRAMVALQRGDQDESMCLARQATHLAADGRSWGVRVRVATTFGVADDEPPANLDRDPDLQLIRAEIAGERHDWEQVLALTESLDDGRDRPARLLMRANALVSRLTSAATTGEAEDAEQLASQLLDRIGMSSPYTSLALLVRAEARRQLGQLEAQEDDLRLAQSTSPDDPQVVRSMTASLLRRGRNADALSVLRHPTVTRNASLLALRAELEAAFGSVEDAQLDLDAAEKLVDGSEEPAEALLELAEAASGVGDPDRASGFLDRLSEADQQSAAYALARARLAWLRRDVDEASRLYRIAAERDPAHAPGFHAEHAVRLTGSGDVRGAKATLEAIDLGKVPDEALEIYAKAMYHAGDLAETQRVLDRLADEGELPLWALTIATNIAIFSDDPVAAEQTLRELVRRGYEPATGRLLIASYLIDRDQAAEALAEVEQVARDDLGAEDRLCVAQLLLQLGRHNAAVDEAYRAFRERPEDPQFHRVFASITFAARVVPETPPIVAVGTHVQLVGDAGAAAGYSILSDAPVDALRGELTAAQAAEMHLLGLAVGDLVPRTNRPGWAGPMKVATIVPAVVHAFQDVVNHYEERFPTEPWFVSRFSVGDKGSLGDFAPIVASLVSKHEMIRSLLETYQSTGLPMGFVAGRAGGSIADLIDFLVASGDDQPPVLVEWADTDRYTASLEAARLADSVVLTRSGLKTLYDLDLLEPFAATYQVIAPRSLVRALQHDLVDADEQVTSGHRTAYATDGGLGIAEAAAGDPATVARADGIRAQLVFVRTRAELASRPLKSVRHPGREDLRDAIGWDSYDAVALAEGGQGLLFADDIGLRMYALGDRVAPSTSSLALIPALVARGRLAPDAADRAVLALVVRRYTQARPYPGLLSTALDPRSRLDRPQLARVFRTLADPGLPIEEAIELATLAIRESAIGAALITLGTSTVVDFVLASLSTRVRLSVASRLLAERLRVQLRLIPQRLDPLLAILAEAERKDR